MGLYRYRTAVLAGPWRTTPEAAEDDAVLAGQAFREAGGPMLRWRVRGRIEIAMSFTGAPGSSGPGG